MNNWVPEAAVFAPNDPQRPEPSNVSEPAASENSGHSAQAFLREYFRELEQQNIPYVILHGYEELPNRIGGDIDYAVSSKYLVKVRGVLAEVAHRRGWVVAQTLRHTLWAYYSVVVDPENLTNHLALDVCSHYASGRCQLVRDDLLLENPRRHREGFFVPAPAAEFAYLLAKALVRSKQLETFLPRLMELWKLDPEGTQRRFQEAVGATGRRLEDWFREPAQAWETLQPRLRARHRYGPLRLAAEALRVARHFWRPPGLHIGLLGPDGAGKSTLLENLRGLLAPCFGQQRVFKFRPDVFGRIKPGVDSDPHGREPRSRVVSWAKVFYYYSDWWLGWFLTVRPALARNAFVVFDRDFDDMLVDQRRYMIQGSHWLIRLLGRLLPRSSATFILEADPAAVHARKPELPVEMLEQQRGEYRRLAASSRRYRLVNADLPPVEVARAVAREIVLVLAARTASG